MIHDEVEQTIADLAKAIEILRENPWDQGQDYRNDTGAFCAWGAIRMATGGLVLDSSREYGYHSEDVVCLLGIDDTAARERAKSLRERSANVGRAFYRVINSDIVTYNDCEGRTKEQMIRAMETVVSTLKENPSRA